MKMLLEEGLLHGDCLTVTGKTVAENLKRVKPYPKGQEIVRGFVESDQGRQPSRDPLRQSRARRRRRQDQRQGRAAAFPARRSSIENEQDALAGILDGTVKKGHVIVIRHEGPVGGPGMREMLSPTSAVMGKGLGKDVALITDGRFSGGSHGFVVGHITPEAALGGPLALVKKGDPITIDAEKRVAHARHPRRRAREAPGEVESPGQALHPRRPRQIRPRRHDRVARRGDGFGVGESRSSALAGELT